MIVEISAFSGILLPKGFGTERWKIWEERKRKFVLRTLLLVEMPSFEGKNEDETT
jgi:hypothetical protein